MMNRSSKVVDFTNTELCFEKKSCDDDTVSTIGSTDSFDDDSDTDDSSASSISSGRREDEVQIDMKDFLRGRGGRRRRLNNSSPDLFAATFSSRPRRSSKAADSSRAPSPKLNARWSSSESTRAGGHNLNARTRMRSLDDLGLTLNLKAKATMRKIKSLDDQQDEVTTTTTTTTREDDVKPKLCRWSSSNQLRRQSSNDCTPRNPRASAPDLKNLSNVGMHHHRQEGGRVNARWSAGSSSLMSHHQRRSMTTTRTRLSPPRRTSGIKRDSAPSNMMMLGLPRRRDLLEDDSDSCSNHDEITNQWGPASTGITTLRSCVSAGSAINPVRGSLSRWNSSSSFKTINSSSINGGSVADRSDQWSTAPKIPRRRRRSGDNNKKKQQKTDDDQDVQDNTKEDTITTIHDTTESLQHVVPQQQGLSAEPQDLSTMCSSEDAAQAEASATEPAAAAKALEERSAMEEPNEQPAAEVATSIKTEEVEAVAPGPGCISEEENHEEEADNDELDSEEEEEALDSFETTFLYMECFETILEEEANEDENVGGIVSSSCTSSLDPNNGNGTGTTVVPAASSQTSLPRCDSALLVPKRRTSDRSVAAAMDESGLLDMSSLSRSASTRRGSDKTMYSSSTGRGGGSFAGNRCNSGGASSETAACHGLKIPHRRESLVQEGDTGNLVVGMMPLPPPSCDSLSVSSVGSGRSGGGEGQQQQHHHNGWRRRHSNPESSPRPTTNHHYGTSGGGLVPGSVIVGGQMVRRPSLWSSHKKNGKEVQGGEFPCHPLLDERHPLATSSSAVVATTVTTTVHSKQQQPHTGAGVVELSTKQYPALAA